MKIKIEKVLPEDLPVVENMILEIHKLRGYPIPEELQPYFKYTLAGMIAGGLYTVFVAVVHKHNKRRVIGMGTMLLKVTTAGPVGYGEDLYVEEKYRGTNVPQMLVKAGEDEAKLRGCIKCVVELKPELQPMFEKFGYKLYNVMMMKDV